MLGIVGIGALIVGAGVVVAAPAGAAPVPDAAGLRQAITALNAGSTPAEIELSPGVTYSLPGSGGCADDNDNATGDLDIRRSQPLKIFTADGKAPAILEMTCPDQRVIEVRKPDGGDQAGKLTLRNVVIRNGHAGAGTDGANAGGGVLSFGDVTVEDAVFENNTAGDGQPGEEGGLGGALAVDGVVTISGSRFTGNKAGTGGAGVGGNGGHCDGGSGGQGGAVLASGGLTITNSTFTGNAAGAGGNGAEDSCGENHPGAGNGGDGGSAGAVECGLIVRQARATRACQGPMVVRGSTFSGNTSGSGGNGGNGGSAGGNGGSGGLGGAIMFIGGKAPNGITSLLVENSTVDGNASGNGGKGGNGGNAGSGGNGGIAGAIVAAPNDEQLKDVTMAKLVHVTITENGGGAKGGAAGTATGVPDAVAAAAGKPGDPGRDIGGSVFMSKWESLATLIGVSSPPPHTPDCWHKADHAEFSLTTVADVSADSEVGCGFGSTKVVPFASFGLGALSDNGGPTQTRLPGATGALVDKVNVVQSSTDQRGVPRPQAGGSDIGAVELQLIDMAVTKTASATSVTAGTEVTFTITVKNTGTSSPQAGVVLEDPKCTGLTAATGDTNTNNTLDPGETFGYTCKATPTDAGTFTNTATATITDGAGVKITRTASVDVTVTAAPGGNSPQLANTGVNDPTPELMTGAWLITGGLVLLLLTRPRRAKIRPNLK